MTPGRTKRPLSPYEAKHGVIEIAENFVTFRNAFSDTIEDVVACAFRYPKPKVGFASEPLENNHYIVDLADTFLSDTIAKEDLTKLFEAAIQHGVPIRVVLLNPMCPQATERAVELEEARLKLQETQQAKPNTFSRLSPADRLLVNLTRSLIGINILHMALRDALTGTRERWGKDNTLASAVSQLPLRLFDSEPMSPLLFKQRMELAQKAFDSIKLPSNDGGERKQLLEVRFTNDQKDMPLYVVGHFAYRGVLTPGKSASESPWIFLIDDPWQPFDIYSTYRDCFNTAWMRAEKFADFVNNNPAHKKQIMVAFSRSNISDLERLKSEFEKVSQGYELVHFGDNLADPYSITEELWSKLKQSCAGIVLAMNDEQRTDGKWQSRPNVIHELGLFQGMFKRERVLILREPGGAYEGPSNTKDDLHRTIPRDGGGLNHAELFQALQRFVTRLESTIGEP